MREKDMFLVGFNEDDEEVNNSKKLSDNTKVSGLDLLNKGASWEAFSKTTIPQKEKQTKEVKRISVTDDETSAFREGFNEGYEDELRNATQAKISPSPSWFEKLDEIGEGARKAGRESGKNALDQKFNEGWTHRLGKEVVTDYLSPVYNSTFRDVTLDKINDSAKADFVASLGSSPKLIGDIAYNTYNKYQQFPKTGEPVTDGILSPAVSLLFGTIESAANNEFYEKDKAYREIWENNARRQQSQRVYDYLNNSEYKYLIDDEKARAKFIESLQGLADEMDQKENVGYLPQHDGNQFKVGFNEEIQRIIHLNQNYDKYKAIIDEELRHVRRGE